MYGGGGPKGVCLGWMRGEEADLRGFDMVIVISIVTFCVIDTSNVARI